MKKILAFLRWEFQGCTRSASFWGGAITVLGVAMLLGKCPNPYPFATIGIGLGIQLCDLVYNYIQFRIKMYRFEQERVATAIKEQ